MYNIIKENFKKYPDKRAIVYEEQSISYKELSELIEQAAILLKNNGVIRNNRVGIYVKNPIEYIVYFLAVNKIGAIIVPIDSRITLDEVERILSLVDVNFLWLYL